MRAALLLSVVGLASLATGSAHAQGHPIGAAGDVVVIPTSFRGGGFAPVPTPTQLDSDVWLPYGIDSAPATFGGTCTMPECARGRFLGTLTGLLPGFYLVDPIVGFVTTNGVGMQSGPMADGILHPGGLRFRFHNIESFPLRAAVLTVTWASNLGGTLGPLRNDVRARYLPACDPSRALPLLVGTTFTRDATTWQVFEDTYATFDMNVSSGSDACIELRVGSNRSVMSLGLSALFELSIQFPAPVCGDGVIETGEDCERPAGGPELQCGCDAACLMPSGTPCNAGMGACIGECDGGECHGVARTDTFSVPGCDDDVFCNGTELCVSGACVATFEAPCGPGGLCSTCSEDLDACITTAGCCLADEDCIGECDTGVCTASVCDVDPACDVDASVVLDGSTDPDGAVPETDATRLDGANVDVDGGASARDGGGSAFDGGPERVGSGFGGGGGCRCAAAGRGPSPGPVLGLGLGLSMLLALQRRRRRTRVTPHASA